MIVGLNRRFAEAKNGGFSVGPNCQRTFGGRLDLGLVMSGNFSLVKSTDKGYLTVDHNS
jgi:hypothetical protein